jgi:tetratricopeptide (TPR) repeat protein
MATRVSLATMLTDAGRFDEAERLWRDTLPQMQRTLGSDHPDTANCYAGLAIIEMHRGRRDAALRLLQQAARLNPLKGSTIAGHSAFTPLKDNPEFNKLLAATSRK